MSKWPRPRKDSSGDDRPMSAGDESFCSSQCNGGLHDSLSDSVDEEEEQSEDLPEHMRKLKDIYDSSLRRPKPPSE